MRTAAAIIIGTILAIAMCSSATEPVKTGIFTESRDGKTYTVVKMGTQTWSTQNLNVSVFSNGEAIPEAKTNDEWVRAGKEKKPAWCYYDNNPANGEKYGKLYNWYAVNDPRGLAPKGWHVPTKSEINQFYGDVQYCCGSPGISLKSNNDWQDRGENDPGNGDNVVGFDGRPGGSRFYTGFFGRLHKKGYWWSSSAGQEHAIYLVLNNDDDDAFVMDSGDKSSGYSVRCIKDQ